MVATKSGTTTATSVHRRLVVLALVLLSWQLPGQTAADVTVYLQEEPIRADENFSVYIDVPLEYSVGFRFGPVPVQDRIRYWGGPSLHPNSTPGRVTYRYIFRASEAGYAVMEPFVVQWPHTTVQSRPLLIPVTVDGAQVPPELEWRIAEDTVYVGQTIYVSLDMYRASRVFLPETLQIGNVNGGVLEEVVGLGELSSHEFSGERFNRIPLATFLYTPLQNGSVRIPNAGATFADYSRSAAGQDLEVLPLPEAIESGAIGLFQILVSGVPEYITAGNEFTFELSVTGTGNLAILRLPEVSIQGADIEAMVETSDYLATERGYSGSRKQSYRVRAAFSGEIIITIPAFTWFDPELGIVQSSNQQTQRVALIQEAQPEHPTFGRFAQTLELPIDYPILFSRGLLGALLFLIVPVYLLMYLSIRKRWNGRNITGFVAFTLISLVAGGIVFNGLLPHPSLMEEYDRYYGLIDDGSTAGALVAGRLLGEQDPNNIGLLFSLAQLEYAHEKPARAMLLMRRAVSLAPARADLREALTLLEEEMNVPTQYPIARLVHGDWVYFAILAGLLFSAIYLSLSNFAPAWTARFIVGSVSFVVIMLLSLSLYFLYYRGVNNQAAVIPEGGAMLKKIPDPDAADWIFLSEGTTVQSGVSASGYIQIRTAYGIVAWIPEDRIYAGH